MSKQTIQGQKKTVSSTHQNVRVIMQRQKLLAETKTIGWFVL